ncbi:hypothetical protein, variant [Puccinia striiformis f. sp. tritici PST-78]|uniref:Uncharacterized protein n=2 Tax=Puccinia striiformis f. sp. tritici TaxID=168172 RepID=A0A0L0W5E1_9BASI|nr:hypothetical protein PSTG_00053 [Puccinia striiformis f. sp. tritici PST-78]KNF06738.1 hypothetical protein, variant [Puccinia striiformis f. sp. tritici PST-78]
MHDPGPSWHTAKPSGGMPEFQKSTSSLVYGKFQFPKTAAGTVSSTQPDPVSIVPSVPSTAAADWRQLDEFKDNPTRYTKPDNEMKSASIDSPASSTSSDRATSVMNEEPDQLLFSSEGYRNTSKEDLKAINKQHRDAYDRLRSTSEGSEFVTNMVGPYNRPLPVIVQQTYDVAHGTLTLTRQK